MLFFLHALLELFNPSTASSTVAAATGNISVYHDWFSEEHRANYSGITSSVDDLLWHYYDAPFAPEDGVSWQIQLGRFHKSKLYRDLVSFTPIKSVVDIIDHQSNLRLQRRGDNVKLTSTCADAYQGYNIIIMVKTPSLKNGYGEIMFFSKSKDILLTVQPKLYTVIVWPCDVMYMWQYPAIATQAGQVFLQTTVYTTLPKSYNLHNYLPLPNLGGDYARNASFSLVGYKRQGYANTDGKRLWVLDDLFDKATLDSLLAHSQHHSRYVYCEVDDGLDGDNVIFVSHYQVQRFTKGRVWAVVEQTLEALTGHKGFYPYDVSTNLNRAWDHTRIHPDCFGRDEYTFLLYLNPTYKAGDLGGTVWYTSESGEEIISSVMNKYGRSALFHCSIPHSARPSHATITQARYTFAVKVARSKVEAVVRMLAERPRDLEQEAEALGAKYAQTDVEALAEEAAWKLYSELGSDVERLDQVLVGQMEAGEEEYERGLRYFQEHAGEDLSSFDETKSHASKSEL